MILTLLTSIFIVGCNDESDIIDDGNSVEDVEILNLDGNSILKFKDQATFDQYVINSTEVDDYYSMYNYFVDALTEAEEYYEKGPDGYEEFKAKYSTLYFPEYENDYSAYLPVSDKNVAKFLNSSGDVIIGGETKNLIDITTYSQLEELELSIPKDSGIELRSEEDNTNKLSTVYGKRRKMWVNVRRKLRSPDGDPAVQIEVCFRRKTWGIWYNYVASTTIGGFFSVFNPTRSKKNVSSHDYYIGIPITKWGYWPGISHDAWVEFSGIPGRFHFKVDFAPGPMF